MNAEPQATIVTGTIGDDVHSLGIKIIEHALKSAGFKVVSMGIQTSQEDFIKAAIETAADAILVSSMSGHARILCQGFREKCIESGFKEIILYLGGNLTTGDLAWDEVNQLFTKMGYNRVYPTTTLPGQVIIDLKKDLGI